MSASEQRLEVSSPDASGSFFAWTTSTPAIAACSIMASSSSAILAMSRTAAVRSSSTSLATSGTFSVRDETSASFPTTAESILWARVAMDLNRLATGNVYLNADHPEGPR